MKRLIRAFVLAAILVSLVVSSVFATVTYTARVSFTNASTTAYTNSPFFVMMNNAALTAGGFITTSGLDVQLLDGVTVKPSMLASDRTLVVGDVAASTFKTFTYSTGNAPASAMYIILGPGGFITTADTVALEMGTTFTLTVIGYFDTTMGTSKNIMYKQNGVKLYVSSAGNITGCTLDATDSPVVSVSRAMASGLHTVVLAGDGANLTLTVDGGAAASAGIGAGVPNTTYAYLWAENNVAAYLTSVTLVIGAVEKLKYQPNTVVISTGATATLPDRDATTDGIITWGANYTGITPSVSSLAVVTPTVTPSPSVVAAPPIIQGITGGSGPTPSPVSSNFPLYGLFEMGGVLLNVPTNVMLNIGAIFLIVAIGIMCLVARLGPLFTGIIEFVIYIPMQIVHVADYWMVFMVITFVFLSWMLPRQTAVL